MKQYTIKFKKRGVFSFNEYDIVVFKKTSSPIQSPVAKIGKYKAHLSSNYESISLDFDALNYWLSRGACLHPNLLELLLLNNYHV